MHLTFETVAKLHKQCWARDTVGKWIVFTGLDTLCMELFVKDRMDWPAIPILHPDEFLEVTTYANTN